MDQLRAAQELNRRHFVASSGLCLGGIALGCLLGRDALAADTSRPVQIGLGGPAWPAAFRSQGEARDLALPVGRTLPD